MSHLGSKYKRIWFYDSNICMKPKETLNSSSKFEKEEKNRRHHTSWFQTILQSYSQKNGIIPALKQAQRSMEQIRKVRKKPVHILSISLWEEPRIYNGEDTVSSVTGVRKTGQLCAKEWNWTTFLYHTPKLTQNGLKT